MVRRTRMSRRTRTAVIAVTVEAIGMAWWLRTPGGRARAAGIRASLRRSSLPSARLYDRLVSPLLGSFYRLVADDVAGRFPQARILEIGAGPGALALELARRLPDAEIVASDVDPAMLARARDRLGRAGVGGRVTVEEADVAALPYVDRSLDLVVTSFSMHHWPDQIRGLDEIHRVLRPGGRALVYDLPEAWRRVEAGSLTMARAAQLSAFAGGAVDTVAWPWRLRVVRRMALHRTTRD
jgi:ubiquinone/menaquinone biosynthesis C-methylase UbiE